MKVFISPSQQSANIGYGNYGSERTRMFQIGNAIVPILQRCGLIVYIATNGVSFQIAGAESNNAKADLHICIHSNAAKTKARGSLVLYKSTEGKRLATSIYNKLAKFTPTSDLGVREANNLYELNNTNAIAVLIEVMFHDNKEDASLIMLNIEALASLIAQGVCDYLKIPFVERTTQVIATKYRVIAGTFTSKENAKNRVARLDQCQIDSYIEEVHNG